MKLHAKKVKEDNVGTPSIVYETPQGKRITFNSEQVSAITEIKKWLNDKENLVFTLSGFAGTGKTTLINYILKDLTKVAVSAPTHKAKIIISKATGRAGETIQKLLGLKPNTDLENFDVNNPQFDPLGQKYISLYRIVVIDEASMLNKDLLKMLVNESKKSKTKLIFMGDEAQLPPINEFKSDVFKVSDIVQLRKVERQSSDNPLMNIYDNIRNNITSKDDVFKHETVLKDGKGIVFYTDEQEFSKVVIDSFGSLDYFENKNYAKVICYTNTSVKHWNTVVRNSLIGNGKRVLEVGDLLMSYNNILLDKNNQIYNSADYLVRYVKESKSKDDIDIYSTVLMDIDTFEEFEIDFLVLEQHNIEKFKKICNILLDQAKLASGKEKKIAWAKYYAFKSRHCLMQQIGPIAKDFDYGYAITVHKS